MKKIIIVVISFFYCNQMVAMFKKKNIEKGKRAPIYENYNSFKQILTENKSQELLESVVQLVVSFAKVKEIDSQNEGNQLYWVKNRGQHADDVEKLVQGAVEKYEKSSHLTDFFYKERQILNDLQNENFCANNLITREAQSQALNKFLGPTLRKHENLRQKFQNINYELD